MSAAIIGVGNPLMGDDGVGVKALELLKGNVPPEVELLELGTGGMGLLHVLERFDAAIIIDAVDFGGEPGEVRAFEPDEVESIKTVSYSLHDVDLLKIIELARNIDSCPPHLIIVAVQPASLNPSMNLSPEVEGSLQEVVDATLAHYRRIVKEMKK